MRYVTTVFLALVLKDQLVQGTTRSFQSLVLKVLTCGFLAALVVMGASVAGENEPAALLLEKGVYAEETEGNLEGAIAIYEQILREHDQARATAAQAQLRLGLCYIKMGRTEDGYAKLEELTTKFPEQAMAVAVAQEKLKERPPSAVLSAVEDASTQRTEEEFAQRRDEALGKGDLLQACASEMSRIRLRTEIGHPYKDKIDLSGLYGEYVGRFYPTDDQKDDLLQKVEELGRLDADEPQYAWRWYHLAAVIRADLGELEEATTALDAALNAYPLVVYEDPSKQSKYHHLVNERAKLLWDTEGVEAAEDYFLERLANDPKCEFCYEPWWKQRYREAECSDRENEFLLKVHAAYEARKEAFPKQAELIGSYAAKFEGQAPGTPGQETGDGKRPAESSQLEPASAESLDERLASLVAKATQGERKDIFDKTNAIAQLNDTRAIPTLIGVIDADNTYDTVYGVGYFGLGKLTGVPYHVFHDGPWWRKWWEKNKARFPEEVQAIPIPDLPKTEAGKQFAANGTDYADLDLDTLEGLLQLLVRRLEKGETRDFDDIARALAELNDAHAIPTMIGVIDADNTYDTVYRVGYFGLGKLTGVDYDETHNGAWWRTWWSENKSLYPEDVRRLEIPVLKKAAVTTKEEPQPDGWFLTGTARQAYEMGVDEAVEYPDTKVAGREVATRYLKSIEPNPEGFGTMMLVGPAGKLRGKRARLSADVKAEGITGWAGLWLRVDGPNNEVLALDNMANRPIKGSTDWTRYEVVLDVGENADKVVFGILLAGPGTVWLANIDLEDVGTDVPVTGAGG